MPHINTRKLAGLSQMHRECYNSDNPEKKVMVLQNQHTNGRYKVYDDTGKTLRKPEYFDTKEGCEEFLKKTLLT